MYNNLLDIIGNTPLVKVNFKTPAQVYAKLESFNPGGSIKDRSAKFMIEYAEKNGLLKPGGTIIEASSGNQGIATAMIGAIKGYKVIITVSEKVSKEKRDTLAAYGAQVIPCKATEFMDDPECYHSIAVKIQQKTPNSYMLNQYFNKNNQEAHYQSLGPEIWEQTKGTVTHFCGGVGSGGTVCGAGRFLKEQKSDVCILGVDSPCSYRSTGGKPKPYAIEGLGVDFDAPNLDETVIDEFLTVSDVNALAMLKTLAHQHGLLVGPASGAVAYAIQEYAQNLTANDTVIMLFGDSGKSYLTKGFYT